MDSLCACLLEKFKAPILNWKCSNSLKTFKSMRFNSLHAHKHLFHRIYCVIFAFWQCILATINCVCFSTGFTVLFYLCYFECFWSYFYYLPSVCIKEVVDGSIEPVSLTSTPLWNEITTIRSPVRPLALSLVSLPILYHVPNTLRIMLFHLPSKQALYITEHTTYGHCI